MNCTTEKILHRLRTRNSDFVSGASLCQSLAISRTAVWKHIRQLRDNGYDIEAAPNKGYRLVQAVNAPSPFELEPLLKTEYFGRRIEYLPVTDSTNRVATELARQDAPEGSVVIADAQTAGRGRLERKWHSPPGCNLYFSLVLRPEVMSGQAPQLALIAGVSVCRAIKRIFPELNPRTKWPNDVYLNNRKLAGILCSMVSEMERVRYLIVGIGINVNVTEFPPELAELATSLRVAIGREVCRPAILATVLDDFEQAYEQWQSNGPASFLEEWRQISYLAGRQVKVVIMNKCVAGTVLGLSASGALRLRDRQGAEHEIIGGDVNIEQR